MVEKKSLVNLLKLELSLGREYLHVTVSTSELIDKCDENALVKHFHTNLTVFYCVFFSNEAILLNRLFFFAVTVKLKKKNAII